MRNIALLLGITGLLGCAAVPLSGCERRNGEGPMERLGEELDRAGEKVGETVEDAADDVKDAAEEARERARQRETDPDVDRQP